MEKTIAEKINDQRIEETGELIDKLPPLLRERIRGRIEGMLEVLEEKKAG